MWTSIGSCWLKSKTVNVPMECVSRFYIFYVLDDWPKYPIIYIAEIGIVIGLIGNYILYHFRVVIEKIEMKNNNKDKLKNLIFLYIFYYFIKKR